MSRASQLYDLQQIDSGLDSRVGRMRQIDEGMSDSAELAAARAANDEAAGVLAREQANLKRLSREADETSVRLKMLERKMYDGSIKNPKELGQMGEEVAHLKARLKTLEDGTLDAMLATEAAEEAKAETQKRLDDLAKEQELFHAGLIEEKDKLMGQARVLQVKRQRAITELPWADLQSYERLRRAKGGIAVATVRAGVCSGCHAGIPVTITRQARMPTELTSCPTCGRILYPLGEAKYEAFDHNLDNVDK
jgi:predicted  nucleic acid-binding Zn-ribbon protein